MKRSQTDTQVSFTDNYVQFYSSFPVIQLFVLLCTHLSVKFIIIMNISRAIGIIFFWWMLFIELHSKHMHLFLLDTTTNEQESYSGPRFHENTDALLRQVESDVYHTRQFVLAQLRRLQSQAASETTRKNFINVIEDVKHYFRYFLWGNYRCFWSGLWSCPTVLIRLFRVYQK